MSRARSASTGLCYGRARLLKTWGVPRSAFYQRRRHEASPRLPARRGPRTRWTDEELVGAIRRTIQESPFHGEGHRKVWAWAGRAWCAQFDAARAAADAPARAAHRHNGGRCPSSPDGTKEPSLPSGPSEMWGADATAASTLRDGQVAIFAMIDHHSAYCLGIHVAKRGTRFEALEPVRQAVREQFGGFAEGVALGVRLRHDHGSQFLSDDFQSEIRFRGLESSPAFVREPEGNGCIERFFRTLKELLLWVRLFSTLEELARALEEFRQLYNEQLLVERLQFQSPRQAHQALLALEPAA